METVENLGWLAIILTAAIIIGLSIAYVTMISSQEVGKEIYVRVLRAEYITESPLSYRENGELFNIQRRPPSSKSISSGGYLIDLRIGNLEDRPLVRIKFHTIGFGSGEIFLISGERITEGYELSEPLKPRDNIELTIFIPSEYVPSGKVLVVEGIFDDGRSASETVMIP